MKTASRRQVRTPVGNKTKRGAELEGTPKTPRSLEASPGKSFCSADAESDDRRLPLKTKRPLQWGNIPKQRNSVDTRGENTMSPSEYPPMKCDGASSPVAALSPICVNAINGNAGQQGADKKNCLKKTKDRPPAVVSPSFNNCNGNFDRQCYGKAKALDLRTPRDEAGEASADEGSCPSSPDISSHGKHVLFWSNAAFNTHAPGQNNSASLIKQTPCSSSCASSASSSRNTGGIALADTEAESIRLEHVNVCNGDFLDSSTLRTDLAQETHFSHTIPLEVGLAGHIDVLPFSSPSKMERMPQSGNVAKSDEESLRGGSHCVLSERIPIVALETVIAEGHAQMSSKSKSKPEGSENLSKEHPFQLLRSPSMKEIQEETKRGVEADLEGKDDDQSLEDGLHEIQQEIERLTERLAELHLQKRKREEDIQRQEKEARKAKLVGSQAGMREVFMDFEKARETNRAGRGACGTVKGIDGGRTPYTEQSPKVQRSCGTKPREETPRGTPGRPARVSAASVSKLSEMRRSVSSTGRRTDRYNSEARMKALRRLSLNGAATASADVKLAQPQQAMSKSICGKGTPSRVVSSRFGRAVTPEACRSCAPAESTPSKKRDRDRPSNLVQPSPSLSMSSIQCSPLRRSATVRSGYPSRSGFSTPSKDRQGLIKPSPFLSSSVQLPLSTLSSPPTKPQDQNRLLLSSPRCTSPLPRFDSPKSTAALYKCLESLLEDSKHFFKHLSPVRPRRLPHLQENSAGVPPATPPKQLVALPAINTCRLAAISPRDSGCVKRASDRLKKRFYFGHDEDGNSQAREATTSAMGLISI